MPIVHTSPLAIAAFVLVVLPRPGDPVRVPRVPTGTVTIDARHAVGEWDRAGVQQLSDGSTVRWQHGGTYLYLAIAAARPGFPSVCGILGDRIRVYHASAALGALTYTKEGGDWSTRDTAFVYGMRNPDSTDAALEERRSYLTQHGWVSTTFRMGGARSIEMQIALSELEPVPRLALASSCPRRTTGGRFCRGQRRSRRTRVVSNHGSCAGTRPHASPTSQRPGPSCSSSADRRADRIENSRGPTPRVFGPTADSPTSPYVVVSSGPKHARRLRSALIGRARRATRETGLDESNASENARCDHARERPRRRM
jgi:hypothetical protein